MMIRCGCDICWAAERGGAWADMRRGIGPDIYETWRPKLLELAVLMQGVEGLGMLRPGGVEVSRGRLEDVRGKIEALGEHERPRPKVYGTCWKRHVASDSRNVDVEMEIACAGHWG